MDKSTVAVIDYTTQQGRRLFKRILLNRQKRDATVACAVADVIQAVKERGDKALFAYTKRFDNVTLSSRTVRIRQSEIEQQARKTPRALQKAMREAAKRIRAFHMRQKVADFTMKTDEGTLAQRVRPLGRVAVYVPGGHTVYPSSVLMNVIPAQVAGVPEIVVVTPPRSELDPGIAFALTLCAVREVYRIGGSQAIAALAFGTTSIRRVDKIVGPGNAYVATAKQQVYGAVDIDSIAGPSEVVIVADNTVMPHWVALDLLAQAEHGSGDEFALCISEDAAFVEAVAFQTITAMEQSPMRDAFAHLPEYSVMVVQTASRTDSIALVNAIAPEHLQIMTGTAHKDLKCVSNAAAVFIGPHTPVALGDYFIGTNHVLPTGGAARFASPLGVESFIKRMSVAEVTAAGLKKAAHYVSTLARAEAFVHHAMSVEQRV